ncbi:hypothetical protein D3C85_1689630 [compost metagenome]
MFNSFIVFSSSGIFIPILGMSPSAFLIESLFFKGKDEFIATISAETAVFNVDKEPQRSVGEYFLINIVL